MHTVLRIFLLFCLLWTNAASASNEAVVANQNVGIGSLQEKLAAGETTSVELVRQALDLAQAHSAHNIFISLDQERSLAAARRLDEQRAMGEIVGPLHGIPVVIKDNIEVAGMPATAGSPALKDYWPSTDASVVQKLRAAGAIMIGKTNMHELAFGITSANKAYGAVGNAFDRRLIGGGSSGGTAVAIALGITRIGLGTDTGGSSRIPAALNGLVGFRPTTGRYAADGLISISHTRDTVGPMAKTVREIRLLDAVLTDAPLTFDETELAGLRFGVPRDYFYQGLDPFISDQMEALLERLNSKGVELVELTTTDIGEVNAKVGFPIVLYETRELIGRFLSQHFPETGFEQFVDQIESEDVREIFQGILQQGVTEADYGQALKVHRSKLQTLYQQLFTEHGIDALIFPTTTHPAIAIEEIGRGVEVDGTLQPVFSAYIRNTDPPSNAGIPGLSIPFSETAGAARAGFELNGPAGSDLRLLAIGAAVERLLNDQ